MFRYTESVTNAGHLGLTQNLRHLFQGLYRHAANLGGFFHRVILYPLTHLIGILGMFREVFLVLPAILEDFVYQTINVGDVCSWFVLDVKGGPFGEVDSTGIANNKGCPLLHGPLDVIGNNRMGFCSV